MSIPIFSQDNVKLSNSITGHMVHPSGKIEEIQITEPDHFDYNDRVYSVKPAFSDVETAERMLRYDVGNPYPRLYDPEEEVSEGYEDASQELMDEVAGANITDQLSTTQPSGSDIWSKLGDIPPWVAIAILAFLVLLSQGTLSGLVPW